MGEKEISLCRELSEVAEQMKWGRESKQLEGGKGPYIKSSSSQCSDISPQQGHRVVTWNVGGLWIKTAGKWQVRMSV